MPADARTLVVGGLTPLTTIDYPGELAAVIYCQGCPWHCHYCHNPELQPRQTEQAVNWADVRGFLESRRGLLDAVVFSGGEPTLQAVLPAAMAEVRGMGFKIGLHTAGCYPRRLKPLLPLLDWVGLDIKALPEAYAAVTGVANSGVPAWRSLQLLIRSGIPHQIRTTIEPGSEDSSKVRELGGLLRRMGAQEQVLQPMRPVSAA